MFRVDFRRFCRWADWTLITAIVWLHVVIFLCPDDLLWTSLWWMIAARDAQALACASLFVAWAVLGPGARWLRAAVLPGLAAVWMLPWQEWNWRLPGLGSWFVLSQLCVSGLTLLGMRLSGLKAVAQWQPGGRERFQISLLSLMALTTAIALALGLFQGARQVMRIWEIEIVDPPRPMEIGESLYLTMHSRQILIGATTALSAIGGIWSVMRPGRVGPRLGILLVAIIALSVFLTCLSGISSEFGWDVLSFFMAHFGILAISSISVLPLRLSGYRLARSDGSFSTSDSAWKSTAQRDWAVETVVFVNAAALAWFLAPVTQNVLEACRERVRDPLTYLAGSIDSDETLGGVVSIFSNAGGGVSSRGASAAPAWQNDPFAEPASIPGGNVMEVTSSDEQVQDRP